MAQHVYDSSVIERRLRPIYDALEIGNSKKALQEADKLLKKNPQIQCARALKSLAMVRMGKIDEAQLLINQICAENPCDDPTLQVMTFCYKELDQLDMICTLYSNASKMIPGNEEILSQLFMAYVRVKDFQSQQVVALQLYKLKPKNPYYFWAVMSIVLKAIRGPDSKDPSKSKLLLALAQRMIDKQIDEKKLDAEQEIQLYLTILQYQNKHEEALELLEGELGRNLYPGAPISLKIDLLKAVNKWSTLNGLMKDLLLDNDDRWDYYQDYISTVLELQKSEISMEETGSCFIQCRDFLNKLIDTSRKKIRGPYLGRLELHRVMTTNGHNANELLGDILELLLDYFRIFGDKPCCANDIILFLDCLETTKRTDLASRLLQICEISSTTLPQTKEQMQKHICSLQISRICGAHSLNSEHLAALYTALSLHYEHGLTAFGIETLPTDMGPSDSYALLAVHVMYDLALKLNSSEPLIEALCLLNYLLSNSPSNFHAKMLCLQLYHIIGCGWGAHKTYENLDIKHVQLDSLGYLHCSRMASCGVTSVSKPLYDSTLKFFTTSYRESLEYLAMCYKFGSFSKLEEFMDFREKLSNSLHFLSVSTETIIAEMISMFGTHAQNIAAVAAINIKPNEDRVSWNELTDNRDLSVFMRWDPIDSDDREETNEYIANESFKQDKELLKIRSTLLRVIAACIETITKYSDSSTVTLDTLKQLQKLWNDEFSRIRQLMYKPTSNRYLVNLLPSRLHGMLSMPYESYFNNLSMLIIELQNQTVRDPTILSKDFEMSIVEVSQLLCNQIKEHNERDDILWNRRNVLEVVVNSIEILSLTALVLSICYDKYSNLNSAKTSKKGKKKCNQNGTDTMILLTDKERLQIIAGLCVKLKTEIQNCDIALDSWKVPCTSSNITERIAAMSLNPNVEQLVNGTIRDSHGIMIKELKLTLKDKLRMLHNINAS